MPRWRSRRTRCRSTAATASSRSTPSRSSCATRRSCSSTRAPRRSSGSSSLARHCCRGTSRSPRPPPRRSHRIAGVCGIGGCVVRPGRAPDREALERLAQALYHRGPDDHGVEIVGQVGLAHARLSIVDPSPLGHQPMPGDGGRWWLSYNGEIFNHSDLRGRYADAPYRGGTDTETLLHALMDEGEAAIGRCNGLYAYAALDVARGRLLLVRDRFGVKPLYLAEHDGDLWFASEIRALLAAGVPARVDRDGLRYTVAGGGYLTGPDQWLSGFRQLLPGQVEIVDVASGATSTRSWF